jgi:hypothetical protein
VHAVLGGFHIVPPLDDKVIHSAVGTRFVFGAS